MTPREEKAALRRNALAARDGLSAEFRAETALDLAGRAPQLDVSAGVVVSGFLPIRSELDLRPLMAALAALGAGLCLPAMIDRETIVFRRFDRRTVLTDNGFGTVAPGPEVETVDPALMLVPMAAFDRRGHRIGYGAGYYDRAIARLMARGLRPRLIGAAFSCQEVEVVPDEPHDRPLHAILTEHGLRAFPGAG